jgi:hypothetical protein
VVFLAFIYDFFELEFNFTDFQHIAWFDGLALSGFDDFPQISGFVCDKVLDGDLLVVIKGDFVDGLFWEDILGQEGLILCNKVDGFSFIDDE